MSQVTRVTKYTHQVSLYIRQVKLIYIHDNSSPSQVYMIIYGHCRAWGNKRGVNKHTTFTVGPYSRTGGVVAAGFRFYESGGLVLGGVVLGGVIPAALGHTEHGLLCRLQDRILSTARHDTSRGSQQDTAQGHSMTHRRD